MGSMLLFLFDWFIFGQFTIVSGLNVVVVELVVDFFWFGVSGEKTCQAFIVWATGENGGVLPRLDIERLLVAPWAKELEHGRSSIGVKVFVVIIESFVVFYLSQISLYLDNFTAEHCWCVDCSAMLSTLMLFFLLIFHHGPIWCHLCLSIYIYVLLGGLNLKQDLC